jgi:hypothetical protein
MAVQQASYGTPRAALGAAFREFTPDPTRFIGTLALAIVKTSLKAANFLKTTRESILSRADTKRGTSGAYNRIDTYLKDDSYSCDEDGLEAVLGDDERAFYESDFDAEEDKLLHIYNKLMQELEIPIAAAVFNTTTWAGAALYTDVKANPWSNIASDIIGPVIDAKESQRKSGAGVEADTLIVGAETLSNMLKNTGIREQFPGAARVTLSMIEDGLPAIFGLRKLLVGKCRYDTADEGQDFVGADAWVKTYAMIAKTAEVGDSILEPCIGRTMLWVGDSPDLVTAEQYREEQARGDVFRGRHHTDIKILDPSFGHMLRIET